MPIDHTVKQGESVMSIAHGNGFLWETLWNHPKNAQLKAKRVDPGVLMPGDVLHIPDRGEKKESAAPDQLHKFKKKGAAAVFRLRLLKEKKDDEKVEQEGAAASEYKETEPKAGKNEPRANEPYALYVNGRKAAEGTTDGNGRLEAKVPPAAHGAWVVLHPGTEREETLPLNIRQMDPIEEAAGVAKRLNNLGYPCPTDAAEITPAVADALRAFQRDNGLDPTGKADAATRDKLKSVYGS